jgi:hypothetical protein
MSDLHLFVRAAAQLRHVFQVQSAQAAEQLLATNLAAYQTALERGRAALRQAVLQQVRTTPALQRRLHPLAAAVRAAVARTCQVLTQFSPHAHDRRSVLADLRELEEEFGGLDINLRARRLAVTTEPVELEWVHLGPFAIRLCWTRLQQNPGPLNFEIEALEPNPAASDETVTHPHVRRGVLCAGCATLPIRRALEQGRLTDAFCLVRSVLTTYNRESPHVALDEWSGSHCGACEAAVDRDDLISCERCGGAYNAVADYFDACVDQGLTLNRCARIWLHTHPGTSAEPSGTDEDTFERVFGSCDWALMFILSRTGQTSARLAFNSGPGGQMHLPVQVDWPAWPTLCANRSVAIADVQGLWRQEYDAHVRVQPERFLPISRLPAGPQRRDAIGRDLERWWQEWEEQLGPLAEEIASDEHIFQFPVAGPGPASACDHSPRPVG